MPQNSSIQRLARERMSFGKSVQDQVMFMGIIGGLDQQVSHAQRPNPVLMYRVDMVFVPFLVPLPLWSIKFLLSRQCLLYTLN